MSEYGEMLSVDDQVARGSLVCPVTRTSLRWSNDRRALVAADGRRYPVDERSVPILLADESTTKREMQAADGRMLEEYASTTPQAPSSRFVREVKGRMSITEVVRNPGARNAVARMLATAGDDPLVLSIGGGPRRIRSDFVNINIGPFENVDVVADGYALPYADGSVDGIHCEAVLEHMEFPERAAAEMFRVLRPGALAYASTPFLQAFHAYPNHYQNFTVQGHNRLFERVGFRLLDSGACVGPTFAVADLTLQYLDTHVASWRVSRALRLVLATLFRRLLARDEKILGEPTATHLASTTFLLAEKPSASSPLEAEKSTGG